jgi:hypothetical protein
MFKILCLLFALVGFNVNAGLITETWKTTLTGGNSVLYSKGYAKIGAELFWTVSYHDDARGFHRWSDGTNNKAEFGANDDVLLHDVYSYHAADAEFDLKNFGTIISNYLQGESVISRDRYTFNYRFTYQNPYTGRRSFGLIKDNLYFAVDSDGLLFYGSDVLILGFSEFVQNGIIEVSEPESLTLIMMLFAIFVMRRKRKSD